MTESADDRVALEQLLADMESTFADTPAWGDNWMPDPATYTVQVSSVKCGTFVDKNDGRTYPYAAVQGRIIGGPHDGREFQVGYFTLQPGPRASIAKGFGQMLLGRDATSWGELWGAIERSLGAILQVDIVESTGKDGKTYTNARARKRLEATSVESNETTESAEDIPE